MPPKSKEPTHVRNGPGIDVALCGHRALYGYTTGSRVRCEKCREIFNSPKFQEHGRALFSAKSRYWSTNASR